jgi:ubiquinone/menaquinone biosynthesis C-methylase UbiE
MTEPTNIHSYYNHLAPAYDADRFGNTYGRYIHRQENRFLQKNIRPGENILDLGCGTGRHLDFATHGIDLSENMIAEARKKFPGKILQVGSAFNTGFDNEKFNQAFSFHVLMHLSKEEFSTTLFEMCRILNPGGTFIFDIPSYKRRNLIGYTSQNWHGANSMSIKEIKAMLGPQWKIKKIKGVLFLPIHRFPKWIRNIFLPFDNICCSSSFKEYASYLMIVLERK